MFLDKEASTVGTPMGFRGSMKATFKDSRGVIRRISHQGFKVSRSGLLGLLKTHLNPQP